MDKKTTTVLGITAGVVVITLVLSSRTHAGGDYCCPYEDNVCFDTYAELVAHVQSVHPGQRIPLPIIWE